MGAIVVGVDGSEASEQAIDWAVGEARLRHDRLVLVHAWHISATLAMSQPLAPTLDWDVIEDAARNVLEAAAARVRHLGVEVETVLVRDQAAPALLRQARARDLLVVGTRGRGDFAGLVLGSVSHAVSLRAPCPVVIVPRVSVDESPDRVIAGFSFGEPSS
jgi:nucleotide-binding universal stress UspA family protein